MSKNIEDRSLDICFIDADHKYQSVKSDIYSYFHKVKMGGVLCGHDCDGWQWRGRFTTEQLKQNYINMTPTLGCHPGVVQAVYEIFRESVIIRPDNGFHKIPIWIVTKHQKEKIPLL